MLAEETLSRLESAIFSRDSCLSIRLLNTLKKEINELHFKSELCSCGHSKGSHGSRVKKIDNKYYRIDNDGSCCDKNCDCKKFRYVRRLYRRRVIS